MQISRHKLIRAGRKTAWNYRCDSGQQVQYLITPESENVLAEFDDADSAILAARTHLASDRAAKFFVCDTEGIVIEIVLDELVQRRQQARGDLFAKIVVGLFMITMLVVLFQYVGFPILPVPLYLTLATLVSAILIYLIIIFPWDTKIIMTVVIVFLLALSYPARQKIMQKHQRMQQTSRPGP